jgi:hypothetical protein
VRELRVQKKYGHINGLLKKVFCIRAADKVGMSMPFVLQESDPKENILYYCTSLTTTKGRACTGTQN